MEKISFKPSEIKSFLDSMVKYLSDELTDVLSQNIDRGWFSDYVHASVEDNGILFEIEYHPYVSEKTNLVIMKPNNNDQTQNIEKYILDQMDFCKINNDAHEIYDSQEYYISGEC